MDRGAIAGLPWPPGYDEALRDALLRAYDEPGRGYHDRTHLCEVLARLAELGVDDGAVVLAAWFHDAVYDGAGDDEERSAAWAESALSDEPDLAAEVGRLVRLTATHRPEPGDVAGAALCDADLAILAAGPERYATYTAGVRTEYAHVPDADFRAGRRAVLDGLLAKEHLFETEDGRARWERAARANLRRELDRLR
ncbi:hypothetical protein GCM10011519_29700 [Marmoricola endophyticus]|uniref:Metal-dependent phosphohydrolase n=1 Tax=Marmoricola endophyticus TaxID=2040280 RepID=A0A917BQJ7_9ACTN|nr:hypothetical protein [Marmoricola endophyticus]GGF53845.1 hypothetical protein GCM10011519_29700 [Marmoricola endophyticus]